MTPIEKGIKWLNTNVPDWRQRVNKDTLDLRFWGKCVLGQVFGPLKIPDPILKLQYEYGFNAPINILQGEGDELLAVYPEIKELTDEWKKVLTFGG